MTTCNWRLTCFCTRNHHIFSNNFKRFIVFFLASMFRNHFFVVCCRLFFIFRFFSYFMRSVCVIFSFFVSLTKRTCNKNYGLHRKCVQRLFSTNTFSICHGFFSLRFYFCLFCFCRVRKRATISHHIYWSLTCFYIPCAQIVHYCNEPANQLVWIDRSYNVQTLDHVDACVHK